MGINNYGNFEDILNADYELKVFIDIHNERIKLTKYSGNIDKITNHLKEIALKKNLGKIICIVPENDKNKFLNNGFINEGFIEGYFKGKNGCWVSYFCNENRKFSPHIEKENQIIEQSLRVKDQYEYSQLKDFNIRDGNKNDAKSLASLFKNVFETYPTPMENEDFIKEIIGDKVLFKVAEINGEIVSAASADIDKDFLNAEITDCATLNNYRGMGLLSNLIYNLEQDLKKNKFLTLYSLSRAISPGINIALSKHNYSYTGRLINNCKIMSGFEDMNVWVKDITS